MSRPVFLDSSDLQDLSLLRHHVQISHNLLVMLTPGILSRPWCLVEIVTAFRHNIRMVPVTIQRPGLSFQFPGEEFYSALGNGQFLSDASVKVWRMRASTLMMWFSPCDRSSAR